MQTDDSFVGNSNDVFYRDASDGHYFSYLMQTGGQTDLSLRLKYWGVGEWKSHEFDIFVDDVLVTSVNNTGKYRISEFKVQVRDLSDTRRRFEGQETGAREVRRQAQEADR